MNSRISREIRESVVRNFIDLLILKELSNGLDLSAKDLISRFYRRFHTPISPGLIYSLLYAMEREGLVKVAQNSKKKVYKLTAKGKKKAKYVLANLDSILSFTRFVLDEKSLSKLL